MGTQGQGANPQPGDRGRKAFSSSQHRCTSPGHRRPWWKDLRWTGGKDTLPRAPVCADRGERCQMGHLKNLQQQVGGQPWTSERHSGSCALEFTGRQSPGRKKHRVYKSSAPCVSSSGGMLCYPWAKLLPLGQTVTPRHFQQGAPGSHTLNISAADTNHLCLHLWEPLSKSQWSSEQQCWRQSFCL